MHGGRSDHASDETGDLIRRAAQGDSEAFCILFGRHRHRLKRLVHLRLSRHLAGRVRTEDVLQGAFLMAARRFPESIAEPAPPIYLWLRQVTLDTLDTLHRRHLGPGFDDRAHEITLHRGGLPIPSAASLARGLLAGRRGDPGRRIAEAESRLSLQVMINSMEPADREMVAMCDYEGLSMTETARVLGVSEAEARRSYLRAIRRLSEITGGPRSSPKSRDS